LLGWGAAQDPAQLSLKVQVRTWGDVREMQPRQEIAGSLLELWCDQRAQKLVTEATWRRQGVRPDLRAQD
jgi:hypothetical protein